MKLLKLKNLLLILLFTFMPLLTAVNSAYAQEEEETTQVLQNIEDERTAELEEQLALTLPEITDNPNHIITFTDPSEEEVGVQLEIDGQGYKKIKSPYTLPSLGIGEHTLKFRFTDKEETRQTLEESLVVVPRPPIINAPQTVSTTQITLTGTALVGSTVDIFLAGGTTNQKSTSLVTEEGTWTVTFEGEFPMQVYNIVAITKKGGFASDFSETVVFEITDENTVASPSNSPDPIHFAFSDLTLDNLKENVLNNLDLIYLLIGVFILGAGLMAMFVLARRSRREKKIEGNFLQFFKKKEAEPETGKDSPDSKKMTLREKFEKAGLQKKDEGATDPSRENSASMSKEEFLKEFKAEDPDDNKGKEKKGSKQKKSVEVSLTSKGKK